MLSHTDQTFDHALDRKAKLKKVDEPFVSFEGDEVLARIKRGMTMKKKKQPKGVQIVKTQYTTPDSVIRIQNLLKKLDK